MLDLPSELIIAVLSRAALQDILRCRRVCKRFNDIIFGSNALQYRIELECSGYVDGDAGKDTLIQKARLQSLIKVETAWRRLSFETKCRQRSIGRSGIYELYGGVFVRGISEDPGIRGATGLEVVKLPSTIGNTKPEMWKFLPAQMGVRAIRDVGIDPGSDLLVLIEEKDASTVNGSKSFDIHLRALSTNRPHPQASRAIFPHSPLTELDHTVVICIVDDLLAVMFMTVQREGAANAGELVVWNWRTGMKIAFLSGPFAYPTSFIFLSPSVFVVPQSITLPGPDARSPRTFTSFLAVYAIPSSDTWEPVTPRLIAKYHLPAFSPKVFDCSILLRSDPSPCPQYFPASKTYPGGTDAAFDSSITGTSTASKPFYADPLKRILVLGMQVSHRKKRFMGAGAERVHMEDFTVFVHSDAFVKLLGEQTIRTGETSARPGKEFAWTEFSQYARWAELKPRTNYVSYVYGQRFVDYEEHAYGNKLHVWDFNPYLIKRKHYAVANNEKPAYATEIFNEGVMEWNQVSDGAENAHYSAPANPNRYNKPTEGGNRPTSSAASFWSLTPVYDMEPSVIENSVFKDKQVWSSLPFRRTTSRAKLANLSGVMMDEERIILVKTSRTQTESIVELSVMSIADVQPGKAEPTDTRDAPPPFRKDTPDVKHGFV